MKKKKLLTLLLCAALLASVLTGCGSTSKTTAAYYNSAADSVAAQENSKAEEAANSIGISATGAGENLADQKLVKRVYIDAETEDLDPLLAGLNEKLSSLGGYVEYQDIYNGSTYASRRYRSATMTIRVPAEKLDSFVSQVEDTSNVVSVSQSQENVTLTYVATESRVKALETEQARLLELMDQAETMADLLEIEARLTDVRSELEQITSQLRVLSNQVDYATVELSIEQVTVYTQVEKQTVWQRIGSGLKENLSDIGDAFVDFFVWLLTYSPQLIVFGLMIVVIVLGIKRKIKKAKAKNTPPQEGQM